MGRKENAISLAVSLTLALGGCSVEKRDVQGGCTTIVFELPGFVGEKYDGITYPNNETGDSSIVISDRNAPRTGLDGSKPGDVLQHELRHAKQICENTGVWNDVYPANMDEFEQDADDYALSDN